MQERFVLFYYFSITLLTFKQYLIQTLIKEKQNTK